MLTPTGSTARPSGSGRLLLWLVIFLALSVVAKVSLAASGNGLRTFTDIEGRTIEAEILNATATEVKIRRDDGRVFDLPRSRLCETDQQFIEDWIKDRAFAFGGLELSCWRVRLNAEHSETRSTQEIKEQWCYKVALRNESRMAFDDLVVNYRVFHRGDVIREKKDKPPLERTEGRISVGNLAAGEEIQIQTDAIELDVSQLKIGWKYVGTGKRRIEDSLEGFWCRVMSGEEILKEFANPSDLPRKQSW